MTGDGVGGGRQHFPKQRRKSVGMARQYCSGLGKVANCQAGQPHGLSQSSSLSSRVERASANLLPTGTTFQRERPHAAPPLTSTP